jgi:hypothetical protein
MATGPPLRRTGRELNAETVEAGWKMWSFRRTSPLYDTVRTFRRLVFRFPPRYDAE